MFKFTGSPPPGIEVSRSPDVKEIKLSMVNDMHHSIANSDELCILFPQCDLAGAELIWLEPKAFRAR